MDSYEAFQSHRASIAVVGLGYVGLPLAVHLGRHFRTLGFDIDGTRVAQLRDGLDSTGEVKSDALSQPFVSFSSEVTDLASASLFIVAVPTPVNHSKQPDFQPLLSASQTIGRHMKPGSVVVYESTVYPGATEEICVPELERTSGLTCGSDFWIGYSPERINPGDQQRTLDKIVKVVAGQTSEVLDLLADVYGAVVDAGIHRAPSIRTAEAAKVIENTQRDVNIALMNELAMIFNNLGIDTKDVLDAAATKWNFLRFTPGLVGGHCIGVDPYYLTFAAQRAGYFPKVILSGRQINDGMGKYIAEQTVKHLVRGGKSVSDCRVLILGLTFKENVPDLRNSKVIDILHELKSYGIDAKVHDPLAPETEAQRIYGIKLCDQPTKAAADAVVLAVPHQFYLDRGLTWIRSCATDQAVLIDVKSAFDAASSTATGLHYWRL